MPSEDDLLLADVHARLRRGDRDGARDSLTAIVRSDPGNDVAIGMLLDLERRAQEERLARADQDDEGFGAVVVRRRDLDDALTFLVGVFFCGAGLWFLARGLWVGLDGTFPTTGKTGATFLMTGRTALGWAAFLFLVGVPGLGWGLWRLRRRRRPSA